MGIPPDHYAVAQVEGANWWQAFRYITMPQMWYALFIAFVFSLINASSASGRSSWWAGNTPTRRCTCSSTLSTIPLRI